MTRNAPMFLEGEQSTQLFIYACVISLWNWSINEINLFST